jgi:signal peptidase I
MPLGRPVRRRFAIPLTLAIGLALVAALMILHDDVRYYRITSGSMQPTLSIGSRVAVEAGVSVRVGEIVAFHPPAGAIPASPVCGAPGQGAGFQQPCGLATPKSSDAVFVKRVVAGPGDLVSIRAGRTIVNGVISAEPFAAPCESNPICNFPTPVRVPAGHYYVLGDNRGDSDDSRFWGPIPESWIVGAVFFTYWPPDRLGGP